MSNPPGPRAHLTSLLFLALPVFSANFRSASLSWTFRLTLVRKRNLPKRMILSQMAAVGEVMKSKLSGELIAGILWLPTALNLLLVEDQLFLLLLRIFCWVLLERTESIQLWWLWWVVGTQTAADILIGDKEFDRGRRYQDIDAWNISPICHVSTKRHLVKISNEIS